MFGLEIEQLSEMNYNKASLFYIFSLDVYSNNFQEK